MRFYTKQHRYYCGIALHARRMYICILDAEGTIRVHRNGPATPEQFLATIAPYGEDLVVAVECIFTWYWVADLCAQGGIAGTEAPRSRRPNCGTPLRHPAQGRRRSPSVWPRVPCMEASGCRAIS